MQPQDHCFLKITQSMASESRDKLLSPQSGLLSIWYLESFIHTHFYNLSIVLEKYQRTLLYILPDFWHILFYTITEPQAKITSQLSGIVLTHSEAVRLVVVTPSFQKFRISSESSILILLINHQ